MNPAWLDSTVAWIGAHPHAAGLLIFLVAFCDALVVVGIIVPALPLLFAVGALVGLGHIDGPYAVACAALGALAGDGLSYWVGNRWGPHMRDQWPFSRFPRLILRGEQLFRRHGAKALLIARFVGAVRPFVPAIAGTLRMPLKRYLPVSAFAAVTWAVVHLAPGWIFGTSYDAVAAVADRLALVIVAMLGVVALVWAVIVYGWRWFDGHANTWLAQLLAWTRAHPVLGRYAAALVDPNRPESASLLVLAVVLLAIGWAWFALLFVVVAGGEPLAIDLRVQEAMFALRNPLADRMMAALASLGDAQVLGAASAAALLWLLWRRRWMAAAHWLAAIAFGFVLTAWLEAVIEMPRPETAVAGFGFPSVAVTMATITFGFFAVLIARELPGRDRVWPWLVAGVTVAALGFARLYFGAHWLSDIAGGVLLGIVWLLVLGMAYRSHVTRSLWMRPLAIAFYGAFVLAALWHVPRQVDAVLAKFVPPPPKALLNAPYWQGAGWSALPARREEPDAARGWPLDVQVAGPLAPVQARLEAHGWRAQSQADWTRTLRLLDEDQAPARQPVLPATLGGHAESLLMRRTGTRPGELHVLRLWPAPARMSDGAPLWIGSSQAMRFEHPLDAFGLWRPVADGQAAAHAAVAEALGGYRTLVSAHPDSGLPVLRLDARASAIPVPAPATGPGARADPAPAAGRGAARR
ncbi:MAG TPA: VTT domain-containing protein [Xanthomonadaceae bacterium]|nr:VTT domain-containing protein [Xanthomonadaceae bacterium]